MMLVQALETLKQGVSELKAQEDANLKRITDWKAEREKLNKAAQVAAQA